MVVPNLTATIAPEEDQEAVHEIPQSVNVEKQSVPDEDPGDEIIQGLDILTEVKLPSTIHK